MNCVELEAKGGAVCLLECGGAHLAEGDKIVVKAEVAARLLLQYKPYLAKVGDVERDKLGGGFYELAGGKKNESKPAGQPAQAESTEKEAPEEVEEDKKLEDVVENKSMAGRSDVKHG